MKSAINIPEFSGIPVDLILEIICKLKQSDLKLLLSCKKLHFIYLSNKRWVTKTIVNSYNFIFTDLSNILFIREKKFDNTLIDEQDLFDEAKDGELENVKFLLKNGTNIHAQNDEALRIASDCGHTEIVKLLIELGADIHAWDDDALRWASECGHIEIVKLLIEAGADIHARSDQALIWASMNGHIEIVKLLIDHSADIHARENCALIVASNRGHTEIVKLIKSVS